MTEQNKTTQAHRFGVWAGTWWRRWRALEGRQLEQVQASGMRHGRLLVRCAFRGGDLLILAGLLLTGYWVLLPVVLVIGFVYMATRIPADELEASGPSIDEVDHPNHRIYWPELHDD
jgi:hypothetical protein